MAEVMCLLSFISVLSLETKPNRDAPPMLSSVSVGTCLSRPVRLGMLWRFELEGSECLEPLAEVPQEAGARGMVRGGQRI